MFTESVLLTPYCKIHIKCFHLGEAALHQAVGIFAVVVIYIIHSLLMQSHYRRGHAVFLITPTEVMLLSPMLSIYVHKLICSMCGICTRASPSTDSILLPFNYRVVRAVKWTWAISFRIVALSLPSTLSITYLSRVPSLGIEWVRLPTDSLVPSTANWLNKIVLTYKRNILLKRVGYHRCNIYNPLCLMSFIFWHHW